MKVIHLLLLLVGVVEASRVADEVIFFVVHEPASIRYYFRGLTAKDFGGVFTRKYNNIKLVEAEPVEGCQTITNADAINGQVAFIARGVCSFAEKGAQAQAAGAVAAIIYDNDEENSQHYVDMVKEDYDYEVNIP